MQTILITFITMVASVLFVAAQIAPQPAPVLVPVLPSGVTPLPVTSAGSYNLQLSPPNLAGPKIIDMSQTPNGVSLRELPDSGGGRRYNLQIDKDALPPGTRVELRTDEGSETSVVVTVTPTPMSDDVEPIHKPEVNDNKDTGVTPRAAISPVVGSGNSNSTLKDAEPAQQPGGLWEMFVDFWKSWGCSPFIGLLVVLSLLAEFVSRIRRG